MSAVQLAYEWERVETLSDLVSDLRKNKEPDAIRLDQLQTLQNSVLTERGNGAWSVITDDALTGMEYDILACSLAPDMSPRAAWMYQTLHGRKEDPYPTLQFVQELLNLDSSDVPEFYKAMNENSPLRKDKLVLLDDTTPLSVIRPSPRLRAKILEEEFVPKAPPGTTRIRLQAEWDQLVLPETHKSRLSEFLAYINVGKTLQDWGAPLPTGPVGLFSGPSGTGKTFSASVIATALGWPLFRVDLGRLVSKYIGETEKNLNAVFDAAEQTNMVLQFDEADSLFSKRGEVRDARDRYANLEVSHLLSRIEDHRGPCILTTNLREHMDPAFARRFHIVIDFPKPDEAARLELWKRHFPDAAPLHDDVDLTLVADEVSLTGGKIKNASQHAMIIAASVGDAISMTHITEAIWRELEKEGRPVSRSEIGRLGPFLKKEKTS